MLVRRVKLPEICLGYLKPSLDTAICLAWRNLFHPDLFDRLLRATGAGVGRVVEAPRGRIDPSVETATFQCCYGEFCCSSTHDEHRQRTTPRIAIPSFSTIESGLTFDRLAGAFIGFCGAGNDIQLARLAAGFRKALLNPPSKAKMRFQSFFVLTTNQPCFFASSQRGLGEGADLGVC